MDFHRFPVHSLQQAHPADCLWEQTGRRRTKWSGSAPHFVFYCPYLLYHRISSGHRLISLCGRVYALLYGIFQFKFCNFRQQFIRCQNGKAGRADLSVADHFSFWYGPDIHQTPDKIPACSGQLDLASGSRALRLNVTY